MIDNKIKKALTRARKENPKGLLKKTALTKNSPTELEPPSNHRKSQSDNRAQDPAKKQPFQKQRKNTAQTKFVDIDTDTLEKAKIIFDCKIHPASDQVKILRTQLLQRLLPGGGNSVLITSPKPGEGKTVNAISLAISLAQEIERTVLLIDANLRNPAITNYFGLPQGKGLSDYLLGKVTIPEILINPGIDKLTLLPGGQPLATSSEVLGASRMEELVQEMKERYPERILVFDGPDILTAADSLLFSKFVDGIVLVVEAESTTRNDITLAIDRIGKKHLIGTILNKSRE